MLGAGVPSFNRFAHKTPSRRQLKLRSCQREGKGRCLPKAHSLLLGELGTQVQSKGAPPPCLALPVLHTKRELRHRGQRSGPHQNAPSGALSSCHEATQISHFSAPGLSFLMCWLRRHSACLLQRGLAGRFINTSLSLLSWTPPAMCTGQALGWSEFCLPEGQTSLRLGTGSQTTLRRPQPSPLLPASPDLAGTAAKSPPPGDPGRAAQMPSGCTSSEGLPRGRVLGTCSPYQSVPGSKSMAGTSVPPPSMSPGPHFLTSHSI